MFAKPPIHAVCLWTGAIQQDPDSQGKEGSLWPEFVILMDTRLPSRQKRDWKRGGGVRGGRRGVVREVMKTIHLVTSLTEREFEVLDFSQRFSERVLCRFMLNAAVTCGDHVQEVLEETTERTSSWLLPSPTSMVPLRSTGSLEKRPRSRCPAVTCTPLFLLLLQWLPLLYVFWILLLQPPRHQVGPHTGNPACMNIA